MVTGVSRSMTRERRNACEMVIKNALGKVPESAKEKFKTKPYTEVKDESSSNSIQYLIISARSKAI